MRRFTILGRFAAAALLSPALSYGESPLEDCAAQFINDDIANAPLVGNAQLGQPFASNVHHCYRDDGLSFYAMEYWPEQFAPRWVAYKLSPENYGVGGCATFIRDKANCYVREETWQDFLACEDGNDPFHADHMLSGTILGANDFGSTGHDRGHLAPRQAFSWHVCATYQTFTMANMSPQRGFLNQDIWQFLERQVLTWAFDEGPLYVATGSTFRTFPHASFAVYHPDDVLDPAQIYTPGSRMQHVVQQHHENFASTHAGDILRPKRDANPDNIRARARDMRMPTGYFKVIYRPAMDGEPAHAIGFLLPHTFENLNMLVDSYDGFPREEAFWAFVSRIDLIEQTSGMRFPGIPASMKAVWGDEWFMTRRNGRDIRPQSCGTGTPQGVLPDSTVEERIAACIDHLQ